MKNGMSKDGWSIGWVRTNEGMYSGSREVCYCSEPCNGSLNPTLQITRDGSNMQNFSRTDTKREPGEPLQLTRDGWGDRTDIIPGSNPPLFLSNCQKKQKVKLGWAELGSDRKPCLTNFSSSDSWIHFIHLVRTRDIIKIYILPILYF